MTVRIAHLSDLHFGKSFDLETWKSVKNEILRFAPQLILVSGDLVDHPSPLHLLAAKCELADLSRRCGAQFHVVPGNHDLFEFGNRLTFWQSNWFYRIFGDVDTSSAEKVLAEDLGEPPGFTEKCRSQPDLVGLRHLPNLFSPGPMLLNRFVALLPKAARMGPLVDVKGLSVLVATLDSNATSKAIGFATGCVADDGLQALQRALQESRQSHLARIAIIHHHLLPIAYSDGQIVGAEPLMVLQNAGTVLSVLSQNRFDLILHGHKHLRQLATVDLSPGSNNGCPITVASAGSAALSPQSSEKNAVNLIVIEGNGRIAIESLPYGGAIPPQRQDALTYREPLSMVKRRAFVRASERQPLRTKRYLHRLEVTEAGDFLVTLEIDGLKYRSDAKQSRTHQLSAPDQGWLVERELLLDEHSTNSGYTLQPVPGSNTEFRVNFPGGLGGEARYTLKAAIANGMMMTRWEAEQRRKHPSALRGQDDAWDEEWIGTSVAHPIEELTKILKLPESLKNVVPFLRCRRHNRFHDLELDEFGDVQVGVDAASYLDDDAMREVEQQNLRFDREQSAWVLTISLPPVGYMYQLRWKLPDNIKDEDNVRGATEDIQAMFFRKIGIGGTNLTTPLRDKIYEKFAGLCENLHSSMKESADSEISAFLFIYDKEQTALRAVLQGGPGACHAPPETCAVPLGMGLSGAAFQQRRIIPWFDRQVGNSFITPHFPGPECSDKRLRSMISIPIYHETYMDSPRPPAWSAIGVLTFGVERSGSIISQVGAGLLNREKSEWINVARLVAHAYILDIRNLLA
jgi:3',5'-cyclic AMP phosphodiesterase CpdA